MPFRTVESVTGQIFHSTYIGDTLQANIPHEL